MNGWVLGFLNGGFNWIVFGEIVKIKISDIFLQIINGDGFTGISFVVAG